MSEDVSSEHSIDSLRAQFRARLSASKTVAAIKALHDEWLGRKSGVVTGLMKRLGSLSPEERRSFGALVNALKTEIEQAIEERQSTLASSAPADAVDVTLPGRDLSAGRVHP